MNIGSTPFTATLGAASPAALTDPSPTTGKTTRGRTVEVSASRPGLRHAPDDAPHPARALRNRRPASAAKAKTSPSDRKVSPETKSRAARATVVERTALSATAKEQIEKIAKCICIALKETTPPPLKASILAAAWDTIAHADVRGDDDAWCTFFRNVLCSEHTGRPDGDPAVADALIDLAVTRRGTGDRADALLMMLVWAVHCSAQLQLEHRHFHAEHTLTKSVERVTQLLSSYGDPLVYALGSFAIGVAEYLDMRKPNSATILAWQIGLCQLSSELRAHAAELLAVRAYREAHGSFARVEMLSEVRKAMQKSLSVRLDAQGTPTPADGYPGALRVLNGLTAELEREAAASGDTTRLRQWLKIELNAALDMLAAGEHQATSLLQTLIDAESRLDPPHPLKDALLSQLHKPRGRLKDTMRAQAPESPLRKSVSALQSYAASLNAAPGPGRRSRGSKLQGAPSAPRTHVAQPSPGPKPNRYALPDESESELYAVD